MHDINLSAEKLVSALLNLAKTEKICILDSCGVGHLGSHLLIAGISPVESNELSFDDPAETLSVLDKKLSDANLAAIFTISYDFGLLLHKIKPRLKEHETIPEPNVFVSLFDCLIIHNYDTGKTIASGNPAKTVEVASRLKDFDLQIGGTISEGASVTSNFPKEEYLALIDEIKERIRNGDTYQTNLTQQLHAILPNGLTAGRIFERLRRNNPAPFAAFLQRFDSTVISASPERFVQISTDENSGARTIRTSPIKGTRPRGKTAEEDDELRQELLTSVKDRTENTMIVDLLRNDLGRVCEFGSVSVEKLCDLEEHPTLFHLVSTISGELLDNVKYSDILRAVFPCGSITGAPKQSTMQIIDELETVNRGLSMGAIGYRIPGARFSVPASFDMSVAIRTMVIPGGCEAVFNVGGGITIDSDAESEYEESLIKAESLMDAIGGSFFS
ncbi:MAG: anthranilate synthase component I family protein [Saprospiraceae bacterium]|nr:anthranilate synthase component I family protein [Pyrinomonadaceae bacterium]